MKTKETYQWRPFGFYVDEKDDKDTPYSFFEVRNYQAEQEGIFLALLNHEYDITIEVPQKRSVVTLNYFKILTLKNDKESIQFDELLNNVCFSVFCHCNFGLFLVYFYLFFVFVF